MTRVPPSTVTLESPRVVTSTPSSLDHVMTGAGFPDEVQVNVAVEPIGNSSSDGEISTTGRAGGGGSERKNGRNGSLVKERKVSMLV